MLYTTATSVTNNNNHDLNESGLQRLENGRLYLAIFFVLIKI